MNSLKKNLFNPFFSHIYIEKQIHHHPHTQKILSFFSQSKKIEITHYKDVFCRSRQNYNMQKQSPCLILAEKRNNLVYRGAPVCQDFGNRHFYYTSSVMNCIFDCEYCYLQGMYPSANLVIFVNLEDMFYEVEKLLKEHPVYLSISYDTDLLALEPFLGYVNKWSTFAASHRDVTIELRTKSIGWTELTRLSPQNNFILAWTLSPDGIQAKYEHRTPSLEQRLFCIKKALDKGFLVRLCFDPMIYTENWKAQYEDFIETVFSTIPAEGIIDASIGVFRITHDYLKNMRKQRPDSALIYFPYENEQGIFHYGKKQTESMVFYMLGQVKNHLPEENIFIWNGV